MLNKKIQTSPQLNESSMSNKGFTLIELLVTVAIAAILLAAGVPSLISTIERNRVTSQMRDLSNNLAYARSEAVSRNTFITVCARDTNDQCGGNWDNGLLVFNDNGSDPGERGDAMRAGSEEILRIYDGSQNNNTLSAVTTSGQAIQSIIFNSRGLIHGVLAGSTLDIGAARLSFILCGQQNSNVFARALIFEATGRARPSGDSNNDGVHEDAKGDAISC